MWLCSRGLQAIPTSVCQRVTINPLTDRIFLKFFMWDFGKWNACMSYSPVSDLAVTQWDSLPWALFHHFLYLGSKVISSTSTCCVATHELFSELYHCNKTVYMCLCNKKHNKTSLCSKVLRTYCGVTPWQTFWGIELNINRLLSELNIISGFVNVLLKRLRCRKQFEFSQVW